MNIVIDVSRMHAGNKHRGVGLYTQFLFEHLQKIDSVHTFSLKTRPEQNLPTDVVHYPFFDFYFSTLPIKKIAPSVVTIHDVIPLLYPHHYKPGIKGKFNYIKQRFSLKNVDHVITNSQTSKTDICQKLSIQKNHITPIAMAANPQLNGVPLKTIPELIPPLELTLPYFLYVGDINFNKNVPYLLTAFAPLKNRAKLVIVSKAMANDIPESQEIRKIISDLQIEKQVVIAPNIPNQPINHLQWLYQNAIAYIQPSLYEGFGIPIIEALACATLVISSTGGSLKEFVCKAIFPINPLDRDSLTSALNNVLKLSNSQRTDLTKIGVAYAHTFSWDLNAKKTLNIYERVARHEN